MARHRSFSSEFKRRIAQEFLDGRAGMHELARRLCFKRSCRFSKLDPREK
jgi:transposase-like protein